ncbi:MAG: hypothetical protein JWM85_1611, partial [Acidimicrobiaceae bacterium]|nr:hypothetical protein [Acidimicrobiaceae bacterium]
MSDLRRAVSGTFVGLVAVGVLVAVMLPLRSHLALGTSALVLVIPVVLAITVGGFVPGAVAALVGFVVDDVLFVPPFGTFRVTDAHQWEVLAVYVVVMLALSQVVDRLQTIRAETAQHEATTRHMFELSDLLIAEKPLEDLLAVVVSTVQAGFAFSSVALLLPTEAGLVAAAFSGTPLSPEELAVASGSSGHSVALERPVLAPGSRGPAEFLLIVPLVATGRPVGAVLAKGPALQGRERELLELYANQAALAIDRSRLRQQVLRAGLLEEVDRWRNSLMGAVSHDLRTPLATVKAAVSTLRRHDLPLSPEDSEELLGLIEGQSDRLDRLVANLLDMTRLQTGALVLRREAISVDGLLDSALAPLAATEVAGRVRREIPPDLPLVEVDPALIAQALTNLLDNAGRHAPGEAPIVVAARRQSGGTGKVVVEVRDDGPGVSAEDRERIFLMFNKVSGAGRAGLGLAIVKAFVEAHGESVGVRDAPGGGA